MSPVKGASACRKRIDVRTDLDMMSVTGVENLTVSLGSGLFGDFKYSTQLSVIYYNSIKYKFWHRTCMSMRL
jgi:hypothetical protein